MWRPLLVNEALDVLSLRPGATSLEVKEAYRDLVKVWHPDRFGSDPRLRRKAEDKLKQINDAYRVLQSGSNVSESFAAEAEAAESNRYNASSVRYSSPEPMRRGGRVIRKKRSTAYEWLFGSLGIALGC